MSATTTANASNINTRLQEYPTRVNPPVIAIKACPPAPRPPRLTMATANNEMLKSAQVGWKNPPQEAKTFKEYWVPETRIKTKPPQQNAKKMSAAEYNQAIATYRWAYQTPMDPNDNRDYYYSKGFNQNLRPEIAPWAGAPPYRGTWGHSGYTWNNHWYSKGMPRPNNSLNIKVAGKE